MADPAPRLALALDTDDLAEARSWVARLGRWFPVAKVGLELYSAVGPAAVEAVADAGAEVFVDLKLHDIPTTVHRAAAAVARHRVTYLTVHTAGGEAMVRACVEGLAEGAPPGRSPVALGVTVLTSDPDADAAVLAARAQTAAAAGCGGVVCAAGDLAAVRGAAPGLLTVVPGIRPAGAARHDQARAATAAEAVAGGAGLLVVGRAVTGADDPEAAAAALAAEVTAACTASVGGGNGTEPRG